MEVGHAQRQANGGLAGSHGGDGDGHDDALQQQWHGRCWPVPPETGWALATAGEAKAIATWDGSPQQPGERSEPEQALCFGPELSGSELLAGEAGRQRTDLATTLLAPLLEQVR